MTGRQRRRRIDIGMARGIAAPVAAFGDIAYTVRPARGHATYRYATSAWQHGDTPLDSLPAYDIRVSLTTARSSGFRVARTRSYAAATAQATYRLTARRAGRHSPACRTTRARRFPAAHYVLPLYHSADLVRILNEQRDARGARTTRVTCRAHHGYAVHAAFSSGCVCNRTLHHQPTAYLTALYTLDQHRA